MNQFLPGGVSPNPQGTAYPAVQPMGNMFAQMQMLNAFNKSSDSYSSSSSKVSIVKYDDHFKKKGADFCYDKLKLKKLNPTPGATPRLVRISKEELKENPPLALKFGDKDCHIVLPIPSYKAMCKAAEIMVRDYLSHAGIGTTSASKKEAADAISQMLLVNFVEQCGYGDDALDAACYDAGVKTIPNETQDEQKTRLIAEAESITLGDGVGVGTDYDAADVGDLVGHASRTGGQEGKVPNYKAGITQWM
ncbi:EsV-1-143 [Ectocarpus siliculosus]|uniref:EsV-1-143 n=1 Tax=Ectocarpus siliculosus TaxID=2880 RepID=D8LPG9_ECTSI|nr:EsV-1-143 [Ectocarpus siliculosus]|eukprot:CBN80441.1 EsV-1-143 [Ectocarpus siliculosus]